MAEDIRSSIVSRSHDSVFNSEILDSVPCVFGDDRSKYREWRTVISDSLNIDSSDVVIVGSAAAGFSMSPNKNLKPFDNESDIDVAIISDRHFTIAWHYLRSLNLTLARLDNRQRRSVQDHRQNKIFWGCIATDRILPILPFAKSWLTLQNELRNIPPTVNRDVNFRIYKDFQALRSYQEQGLKALKTKLLEE